MLFFDEIANSNAFAFLRNLFPDKVPDHKQGLILVKKGKLKAGDAHKELDDLTSERSKVESDLEKIQVKTSIHRANHLDAETTENCLLNFSHLIDKGTKKLQLKL